MASSKLKINKVRKPKLFFGKYLYKISITEKEKAAKYAKYKWYARDVEKRKMILTEPLVAHLVKNKIKTRVEGGHTSKYLMVTAFVDTIDDVKRILKLTDGTVEECEVFPYGVLYFKRQPEYEYRLFFSNSTVSKDDLDPVLDYCKQHSCEMSPGLVDYLNWRGYTEFPKRAFFLSPRYFINCNNSEALMLTMKFGDFFSKTCKLEKEPD